MHRWFVVVTIVALFTAKALACPSCAGDTPPDEDGLQSGGEAVAYGLSIAMMLGAPAFVTCALGYIVTHSVPDQPPGEAK